ncbi:heme-binding protein [Bacillus sp. P2(2020)]|uniref:Heme-binding protein n=1 Tax=Calidifontibacillus erzurumensis TaxID=2741433 RepID=A0A8J8KA95_9BACI|nr:heme-binding protein [Calidifontibacillus erzurumensis]
MKWYSLYFQLSILGGVFPINLDGKIFDVIDVSGGSAAEDEKC